MSNAASPTAAAKTDLPKYVPWMYMFYQFLYSFGIVMALNYVVFFVTEYAGMTPTLMASFLSVARLLDLFVSMFSGAIIQRQKRMRPWLLGVPLVGGTGAILVFLNPPIPLAAKTVLVFVGYCCIHFPMNFITVAQNTLIMKVAGPNPANRLPITSMVLRGSSAARIAYSAATLPMIMFLMRNGLPGYLIMTIAYFILWLIGAFVLYFGTSMFEPKEDPASEQSKAVVTAAPKGPSILQMYIAAFKNRPIMILVICGIITGAAGQVLSQGAIYYYRYSIGGPNWQNWQAIAGTVAGVVALGTAIIGPLIGKKIGKRNSFLIMYVWCAICELINMFFMDGNVMLYIVVSSVMALGTSISGSWGINLYLDAAEVQYHETGVDNRPFMMSINNFPTKTGFIFSGPLVAFMLNSSDYKVIDNVGQLPNTQTYVYVWMGIIVACYVAAFIIFLFGYKIDERYAAEAAASNAEKAAAAKAAAEA